jgi:Hint domain
MARKSSSQLPTTAARRHFMGIIAAGAGRLSAIAIASSILVGKTQDANTWGIFPRHAPGTGPNCFARGTRVLTSHGEVPVEDLANGGRVLGGRRPKASKEGNRG